MKSTHTTKYSRKQLWFAWTVVSACLAYAELDVWSRVCACGYMTTRGIGTSSVFAASAWVGLVYARRSPWSIRVALAIWTIFASLVLAYHAADCFIFSPHPPFE